MLKENFILVNRNCKLFLQICSFALALIAFAPSSVLAQEMHADNAMPVYPGGIDAMNETIMKNLRYPEAALKAGISGTVLVHFTVDPEGEVHNIKVMQGLSSECDAEAIRLTSLLKGWEPARRQGTPVNVTISMPVEFKSDKKIKPTYISGKVTEWTTGKPIEGAFVIVKGTNVGSVTNKEGSYRIELPLESTDLIIFSMGYSSIELPIDYHSTINIELVTENYMINFKSSEK